MIKVDQEKMKVDGFVVDEEKGGQRGGKGEEKDRRLRRPLAARHSVQTKFFACQGRWNGGKRTADEARRRRGQEKRERECECERQEWGERTRRKEGKRSGHGVALVDLLEVGVGEGLLGRDAGRGIEDEHLLEEVDAGGTETGHEDGKVLGLEAGECVCVVVWKTFDSLPRRVVWRSHDLKHFVDLIDLRVALEERTEIHQLSKDAAHRPHVDRHRVSVQSEQDLCSC